MDVKKYNMGLAFLRIWMCFEVVICHFKNWDGIQLENMTLPVRILYDFRDIAVPVFMLLAFSLTDIEKIALNNKLIGRRMYRLLIPQLVWSIAYFLVYCLLDFMYGIDLIKGFSDFLWQLLGGHSINPTTWYQIDLILLTVFFVLVFRVTKREGMRVVMALGMFALCLQYLGINGALFDNIIWEADFDSGYIIYPYGRLMEMVPYAVLGILCCHFNLFKRLKSYKKEVIVFALSLIYIFMRCEVFIEPLGYGYSGLDKLAVGMLVVFVFYYLPFDKLPYVFQDIIKEIAEYTTGIYFGHRMIGTLIYNSRLQEYFRMKPGSIYDCIVIFLVCLIIFRAIHKIPFKWIRVSVS